MNNQTSLAGQIVTDESGTTRTYDDNKNLIAMVYPNRDGINTQPPPRKCKFLPNKTEQSGGIEIKYKNNTMKKIMINDSMQWAIVKNGSDGSEFRNTPNSWKNYHG